MIDAVLDIAMKLEISEREMLIHIINKRNIEERRNEIARNEKIALDEFDSGELEAKSASEIIDELEIRTLKEIFDYED